MSSLQTDDQRCLTSQDDRNRQGIKRCNFEEKSGGRHFIKYDSQRVALVSCRGRVHNWPWFVWSGKTSGSEDGHGMEPRIANQLELHGREAKEPVFAVRTIEFWDEETLRHAEEARKKGYAEGGCKSSCSA